MDIAGAVFRKLRETPRYRPRKPSFLTINITALMIEKLKKRLPFAAALRKAFTDAPEEKTELEHVDRLM